MTILSDAVFVLVLAVFFTNGDVERGSRLYDTRHECMQERSELFEKAKELQAKHKDLRIFIGNCVGHDLIEER